MDYRQPFIRAPLETLRITLKTTQIAVEKDLVAVTEQLRTKSGELDKATLDQLIDRATKLRAKLVSLKEQHVNAARIISQRADYLVRLSESTKDKSSTSYQQSIDDLLNIDITDYFMRNGYMETARSLSENTGIQDLVDMGIMQEAATVIDSLRAHQTSKCLAWCIENRVYLKKTRNPLEFEIRLQQYLVLISQGRRLEAITYSRRHLSKYIDVNLSTLYEASLAVLSGHSKVFDIEKKLGDRWEYLVELFMTTFLEIHGKDPHVPLFEIVGAGLSALRTYSCDYDPTAKSSRTRGFSAEKNCPACSSEMGVLAKNVPYAHHIRSYLDPDPLVLPNGRIYGQDRLKSYAQQMNVWPKIVDPTTLEIFEMDELKKVFPS